MKLKKAQVLAFLFGTVTVFSFQNCAPPKLACDSSSGSSTDASCSQNSNSTNTGGTSNNGIKTGSSNSGSSGSSNSSSSGLTPPPSSSLTGGGGSSGGFGPGGGSSGGGSAGGFGPSTGSGGSSGSEPEYDPKDLSFRIVKAPASQTVNEGEDFSFGIKVYGGTTPYKYQWYRDEQPIQMGLGTNYYYADRADRWSKQARYHVVVTDAKGLKVTSLRVSLTIREIAGGCAAGTYYLLKKVDGLNGSMNELFHNSRGKWAISPSYDEVGTWSSYGIIRDQYLQPLTNNQAIVYSGTISLSCRSEIAYIHTPSPNPNSGSRYYDRHYEDGNGYRYVGAVTFECKNNRFLFLSNSCAWERYDTSSNGGDGGN